MVRLRVRRIGNSLGIVLPAAAVQELRVKEGNALFLTRAPGGCFLITPHDPDFADAVNAAKSVSTRYRNALRKLAK